MRVLLHRSIGELTQVFGRQEVPGVEDNDPDVVIAEPPPPYWSSSANKVSTSAYIGRLWEYSRLVFDFRRTRSKGPLVERSEAKRHRFTEEQIRAVHAASVDMQMTGEHTPEPGERDFAAVLGGMGHTVVRRTWHLGRRLGLFSPPMPSSSRVSVKTIVLMGSQRPVAEEEKRLTLELLATLAFVEQEGLKDQLELVKTEFDITSLVAERMFRASRSAPDVVDTTGASVHSHSAIRWLTADSPSTPPIVVVSAPSSDPGRRADTPATLRFLVQNHIIEPGASVIVVGNMIFMYQGLDASRELGLSLGCHTELDGFPNLPPYLPEDDPRVLFNKGIEPFLEALRKAPIERQPDFHLTVQEMLQEINSAYRSALSTYREASLMIEAIRASEPQLGP